MGSVQLPRALAELDLIDECRLVVHPGLVRHGPTIFEGLSRFVALKLVDRQEFASGGVALRREPERRSSAPPPLFRTFPGTCGAAHPGSCNDNG